MLQATINGQSSWLGGTGPYGGFGLARSSENVQAARGARGVHALGSTAAGGIVKASTVAEEILFRRLQLAINSAAKALGLTQRASIDGDIGPATGNLAMLVADTVSKKGGTVPTLLRLVADSPVPPVALLADLAGKYGTLFNGLAATHGGTRWKKWAVGLSIGAVGAVVVIGAGYFLTRT